MLRICVSPVFALMLLCFCYVMMGGDTSDGGGKCALTKKCPGYGACQWWWETCEKTVFIAKTNPGSKKNVYFLFQASNKTTAFMIRSAVASATASAVSLPEATKKEADEEDRRRKEKT